MPAAQRAYLDYLKEIRHNPDGSDVERLQSELKATERQVDNLGKALADGYSRSLTERLQATETRLEALRASLASSQALVDRLDEIDEEALADELRLAPEPSQMSPLTVEC